MPLGHSRYRKLVVTLSALVVVEGCAPDVTAVTRSNIAAPVQRSASSTPTTMIYGPATFTRSTGAPVTESANFAATAGSVVTFVFTSDSPQGLNATVVLNGAPLFATTGGAGLPTTVVAIAQASNELLVTLKGKPGGSLTISATIPTPPAPGLVLHYPLDGNGNDVSGSNLHATMTNAGWVADRHGSAGGAFHVPTNNAWGLAPFPAGSPISFPTTGQFSAAMWVKADSLPGGAESGVILNVGVSDFGWAFAVRPSGVLIAQVCTPSEYCFSTEANPGDVANTPLVPGQWVHLAMIYDGSAGRLTFYRNGARVGYVNVALSVRTTDTEVWFGTAPYATQYWFRGAMDDIRVYDRLITPSELSALSVY